MDKLVGKIKLKDIEDIEELYFKYETYKKERDKAIKKHISNARE